MSKIIFSVLLSLQLVTFADALLLQTKSLQRNRNIALRSVGSDLLQRPEDEDSPEYRDYLKNLMKMQANRAKSGHAAPSSGSSDAYFAKLSRLKMERQALRRAGLPDDMLDTSYTQDDFDSAIYESQEPLISATILSGDAAIATRERKSNAKVRSKTFEEMNMEEAADRKVEEARALQESLPESERAQMAPKFTRAPVVLSSEPSPDQDLIDNLLSRRALIQAKPQAEVQQPQQKAVRTPVPTPVVSKPPPVKQPVVVEKVAPAASAVPLRPLPPRQTTPPPPPVKQVVKSTPAPVVAKAVPVPAPPAKVIPAPVVPVRAVAVPPPVATPVALTGKEPRADELELMARSLQILVKHRGGGPFGPGRLQSKRDIEDMEKALMNTVEMLNRLDGVSRVAPVPVAVPVPAKVAPAPVQQKVIEQVRTPAPVAKVAPPPPAPAAVPVRVPQQARVVQEEEEEAPMTIAQGLNQFLSAPQLRSSEELEGLRDGLIQCLYMVQTELTSRPPAEEIAEVQNSSLIEAEAVDRIMRINAPAMAAPVSSSPSSEQTPVEARELPVEQEIKLALGLLLKHRGGPGFGHGRLVGKELDMMAAKLRSVSQRLIAESANSV